MVCWRQWMVIDEYRTKVGWTSDKGWTNIIQRSNKYQTDVERTWDESQTEVELTLDRSRTDIGQKLNKHWMEVKQKSYKPQTNLERKLDETTKWQNGKTVKRPNSVTKRTVITMNYVSNVVEWLASTSFAVMACKREKRNFFLSTSCFLLLFSSSSSSRVATRATHYMTTSLKTYMNAQPRC
jgi:hypothetical protein